MRKSEKKREEERERGTTFERRVNEKRRVSPTIRSYEPDFGIRIRYPFSGASRGRRGFVRLCAGEGDGDLASATYRQCALARLRGTGRQWVTKGERDHSCSFYGTKSRSIRLAWKYIARTGRTAKKEDRRRRVVHRRDVAKHNYHDRISLSLSLLFLSVYRLSYSCYFTTRAMGRGCDPPRCYFCRSSLTSARSESYRRSDASQSRSRLKKSTRRVFFFKLGVACVLNSAAQVLKSIEIRVFSYPTFPNVR